MPVLIVVAGPTASGKTALSIQIATHFSTEIISADSRQFYQDLNIGTAKPGLHELMKVKHHFIDSLKPEDTYNVSDFEKDALNTLIEIYKNRNTAVLAGGSGLYIRALCHGIDDLPGRDDELRNDLETQLRLYGIKSLQEKLQLLDPEYAASSDISNPARLIRALEVCILSGDKYSNLRKKERTKRDFRTVKIGLLVERDQLYHQINTRVDQMMADGLVEEARKLLPFRHLQSTQTVGYQEMFRYFDGTLTLGEAVELIKKNTRNYAKRQMTWFRKEEGLKWFSPEDTEEIISYLEKEIRHMSQQS